MSPLLWLLLIVLIFITWFAMLVAEAARKAVEDARERREKPRGVSICPVTLMFPLALWLIAVLADFFVGPWGTLVIGGLHAAVFMVCVVTIARDAWRVRCLTRDRNRKV